MGNSSSQEPVNSEQERRYVLVTGGTNHPGANEIKYSDVTAPPMFATKDDFIATWFSWKNEFLAYLKSIDRAEDKKQLWGIMLLNHMGPVAQEIYRTFSFYDKNTQKDINVLIKKFDIYCVYGDKKRGCEDIDKYINDLKVITGTWNFINPAEAVKEKIIQDISIQHFTGKAAFFIKSKGENFIPYLQSLSLNNIILLWKRCEDLMAQEIEKTPKQDQAELPQSTITAVTVPPKFATKNDFIATWFSWKNEFLAYLKSIDRAEDKKQLWGVMLLNRMGPVGQEIHRTFPFYDKNAQEDVNVLIKKFDIYCVYGDKKRGCEDIDKYINDLKFIASNYVDSPWIVKEKVIQDISTQRFTGKAALLIENKGEHLIPYLQRLDLNDVIVFWKQCEKLMAEKVKETSEQNSPYAKSTIIECTRCGTVHNRNRCPAWGAQCNKCKQFNHFTDNCKVKYVDDCSRCGMSHIQSRCPAYGELCTKCGKRNHFSLKCQIPFVNNCSRCGMNHAASMCPAQGQTCRHCNKPNHLEERCASKFNNGH